MLGFASSAISQQTGESDLCQNTPDQAALARIGDWIYRNECNRNPRCLVDWNPGESFPSLGIGHFIWYPTGVQLSEPPGLTQPKRRTWTTILMVSA